MEPTIATLQQEVKAKVEEIGKLYEGFKTTHTKLEDEVKKLGSSDVLLKESVDKMTTDFAAKHEALTNQIAQLETKLNRPPISGSEIEEGAKMQKEALAFERMKMARYRQGQFVDPDSVTADVDQFKRYNKVYDTYLRRGEQMLGPDRMKDLTVGSDPDGGYYVRPEWSARIIGRLIETSPIRSMATVETISGMELKLPIDQELGTCGWVGETQARAVTTTPQVGEKSIVAHEMYAKPRATQTLLEDAAVDMERWLMGKVSDAMSRLEATAFVSGTGVGKPRGFLTYPEGTSWGQIEWVHSGSASTFSPNGLINIVAKLKDIYLPRAQWLIRRATIANLMQLKDDSGAAAGQGHYIFQPIFNTGFNNVPLLGFPIRYAADMPAVAGGALALAFGDFAACYTIVDRVGISILRDPYSDKPYIQFYTRRRVGGDVVDFDAIKLMEIAS